MWRGPYTAQVCVCLSIVAYKRNCIMDACVGWCMHAQFCRIQKSQVLSVGNWTLYIKFHSVVSVHALLASLHTDSE